MKIKNAVLILVCFVLGYASFSAAQQTQSLDEGVTASAALASPTSSSTSSAASNTNSDPSDPGPGSGGPPQVENAPDDQWHLSVSPYLWFAGTHGTAGAFNRDIGYRASAIDLLSHFRFGLMGTAEARHDRVLFPLDMIWIRLRDDKALPFPGLSATSANIKVGMFILTPKTGFRVINGEKVKADFLMGLRYWHFGENLQFNPSRLGLNFSKSQNWVDPLVGGRIEAALSQKSVITVAGDVGGWGAASQLEYQVVGLLGYKLNPNITLQAGYRYLYADYQKNGPANATNKFALSGIVLGVTLNLK
jgi:opacity protein-like surface antigen